MLVAWNDTLCELGSTNVILNAVGAMTPLSVTSPLGVMIEMSVLRSPMMLH